MKSLERKLENESFTRAAFSPSGSILALVSASVSPSGLPQLTLRLWNTAARQMVAELPMGSGRFFGLAFAKDGRTLVTSSAASSLNSKGAGDITLWRVPEGTKLSSYPVEQAGMDPGTSFAASPDLSVAAYGMEGGRIRVLDLHNGKELWTAVASKEYVLSLAFSQDGKTLASGAGFADSAIGLWDVATGRPIGKLEGHGSWISSLVFWPDGKKLASSSADQTIRIWDIASQKCLDVLRGHRQEVWRLALLPDERTLLSGAKDGTVCFWDSSRTHPRQARITLSEKIVNWGFTADGRSILALDEQGQVSQWTGSDFQRKEPLLEIGPTVPDKSYLYWFSPDGRFLSTGSTNGVLQIWDLSRRILVRQWTNTSGEVQGMNFLPARNKFVSLSLSDNVLHEWDLTSGLETQSWPGPASFSGWTCLLPDEWSFMMIGYGGDIVFRNLAEKKNLRVELDVLEATGTTYSPDGKLFAAASDLGHAKVWDTTTWRLVATLGGVLNGMHTVAFAPDGQRLAIASDGNEAVKLWATESWQDVFTLEGQGTGFKGAVFSPDGNTIAWGNQTGGLHLWRAPSWKEIAAAEMKEKAENE